MGKVTETINCNKLLPSVKSIIATTCQSVRIVLAIVRRMQYAMNLAKNTLTQIFCYAVFALDVKTQSTTLTKVYSWMFDESFKKEDEEHFQGGNRWIYFRL